MPAHIRPLVAILVAALLSWGTAFSQNIQAANETLTNNTPSVSAGLRAYLDPTTGRLIEYPPYGKPTLELGRQDLDMFNDSGFGLIEEVLPDGTVTIDLNGRFREGTVATQDDRGELRFHRIGSEMYLSPAGERLRKEIMNQVSRGKGEDK